MPRLRLGVIGAGSWAVASHLPNFAKRREEVEFVAVSRRNRELLRKIKDDWGFAVASRDYRDVIAAGIDICVVSSPAAFHYEHAKAALEAGAHVLVEKPVTIDPADAWDLVETAQCKGLHLVCAFGWNYKPLVREAKRVMVEEGIGEIEAMGVRMASAIREVLALTGPYPVPLDIPPQEATSADPALSGGGYAQAQLSHALGLALWLSGLRGAEVFALMSTPPDASVELHDAMAIRFENGAIGTLSGNSMHLGFGGNRQQLSVSATGSEGNFECDLERERVWLFRPGEADVQLEARAGDGLYECVGPPDALVDLALGKEVDNCSPGELGARTVEILDAAYRSAASGRMETVTRRQPSQSTVLAAG